jgi:hypothetical protein
MHEEFNRYDLDTLALLKLCIGIASDSAELFRSNDSEALIRLDERRRKLEALFNDMAEQTQLRDVDRRIAEL